MNNEYAMFVSVTVINHYHSSPCLLAGSLPVKFAAKLLLWYCNIVWGNGLLGAASWRPWRRRRQSACVTPLHFSPLWPLILLRVQLSEFIRLFLQPPVLTFKVWSCAGHGGSWAAVPSTLPVASYCHHSIISSFKFFSCILFHRTEKCPSHPLDFNFHFNSI